MKKIFFLINSLEWWWAERVIVNISEKLSEKYDVTIITLKNINFYELPKKVKYLPLSNTKNNFIMILLFPLYIFKFKKLLKNINFYTWISSLEIANFINILANKKPIISFEISIKFFNKWLIWFIYKVLIKIFYPKTKKIKVNSEENKYDLAKFLNINLEKIEVIYNPLNTNKISQLKNVIIEDEILKKINWKKVFITVWRLVWQKYHYKLINSFSQIENNNWIYLIIWDWPERKNLETLVSEFWLSKNILFLWEQKNIFKYLNISNYFIYASKIEWFPNVLWEAMACNLPIITSDFVSWAKECIIWKFDNNLKKIKYPYYWNNWVLLNFNNYEKQFNQIYNNLNVLKQNKIWLEKFDISKIEKKFENLLFNKK